MDLSVIMLHVGVILKDLQTSTAKKLKHILQLTLSENAITYNNSHIIMVVCTDVSAITALTTVKLFKDCI